MMLSKLSHLVGKIENFQIWRSTLNCLKSKELVIAKLFLYILTRNYNNFKTLKFPNAHNFQKHNSEHN
jgi:hypothetical protein